MNIKFRLLFNTFLLLKVFLFSFLIPSSIFGQAPLSLGPIPVRNQFPISLRFLNFTPDTPRPLAEGTGQISYQLAIGNSFINTRGDSGDLNPELVSSGLEEGDFILQETGQPRNGYNLYIDVETYRHLFKIKMGTPFETEISVEWPLIGFTGGFLDRPIEVVHEMTGVDNNAEDGGFRSKSDRNRFDYYLIRNNQFIFNSQKPFDLQLGDPVFDLKWNFLQESKLAPNMSLKLSYKFPWDSAEHYPRNLISSGHPDYGVYFLFSKSFFENKWIGYWEGGETFLEASGKNFKNSLKHAFLAIEYHPNPEQSWLIQWAHQSSIFPSKSPPLDGTIREYVVDRGLGQATDVLTLGVKQIFASQVYYVGFSEDVTQTRNEVDFLLFFGMEWQL
ncbi:MAG: hypothetical protein HQM13_08575 [SAR324 cluster bacterium]|nr:hypothetical protein [SAR324 cluster bacterium]